MMKNPEINAALDIGTMGVRVVVAKANTFGKLEIMGMGKSTCEGVRLGKVINIVKTTQAISEATKQAEKSSGVEINNVNVNVACNCTKSILPHGEVTSTKEQITQEDIARLINDVKKTSAEPGYEIIHILPKHYSIDGLNKVKHPVGTVGVKLAADFHVVLGQTDNVKNIEKCVRGAGLEINKMVLESLASSLAVLTEEEKKGQTILINIGGETTDIIIYHDELVIHTATLPLAGEIVTSDIKYTLKILKAKAEQMKIKHGRAYAENAPDNEEININPTKGIKTKNLAHIIQDRLEEIIDFIKAEVERCKYYEEGSYHSIVLTGGGANMKDIDQLFLYKTGMDTRIAYPDKFLQTTKYEEVKDPIYSTAIGLLLCDLQHNSITVNFSEHLQEKKDNSLGSWLTTKIKSIASFRNGKSEDVQKF